jgi:shikimate kinase
VPTKSESQSRPIYLVGMMGAGKSTVGPRLAARLHRRFVDTDREVELRTGYTIAEIFEHEGEAHFRELEVEAIDFASKEAAVVALGGGAIVQPRAIQGLLDRGTIVYLSASPEILVERIGDGAKRPLLAGLDPDGRVERLTSLLAERRVHYEKASITVDASRNADEVVDEIVVALQQD